MTGTHTQNPIYSRITFALMEDTGWYLPNYDMADNFKWGRNLSCNFALNSCLEWMETRQRYFLPSVLKMMTKDYFLLLTSGVWHEINPIKVIIYY